MSRLDREQTTYLPQLARDQSLPPSVVNPLANRLFEKGAMGRKNKKPVKMLPQLESRPKVFSKQKQTQGLLTPNIPGRSESSPRLNRDYNSSTPSFIGVGNRDKQQTRQQSLQKHKQQDEQDPSQNNILMHDRSSTFVLSRKIANRARTKTEITSSFSKDTSKTHIRSRNISIQKQLTTQQSSRTLGEEDLLQVGGPQPELPSALQYNKTSAANRNSERRRTKYQEQRWITLINQARDNVAATARDLNIGHSGPRQASRSPIDSKSIKLLMEKLIAGNQPNDRNSTHFSQQQGLTGSIPPQSPRARSVSKSNRTIVPVSSRQTVGSKQSQMDAFLSMCQKGSVVGPTQFAYLVKQEYNDYYNLRFVDYMTIANSDIRNYFTISAKGVTRYENCHPVEFQDLTSWAEERRQFNQMQRNVVFFANFRKFKSLKTWKSCLAREKFKKISKTLSNKLFLLNADYRSLLLKHNEICCEVEHIKVFDFGLGAQDTESIMKLQGAIRNNVKAKLNQCSDDMHLNSTRSLEEVVQNMRQSILVDVASEITQKRASDQKSKAFQELGFPENISYGHRSMMRLEFLRFLRLAYLLDFMAMQSLGRMQIANLKIFTNTLQQRMQCMNMEPMLGQESTIRRGEEEANRAYKQSVEPLFIIRALKTDPTEETCRQKYYTYSGLKQDGTHFDLQNFMKFSEQNQNFRERKAYYEDQDKFKSRVPTQALVKISPSFSDLSQILKDVFMAGEDSATKSIQRWSRNPQFLPYVYALEQWDEIVGGSWASAESPFINTAPWTHRQPTFRTFPKVVRGFLQDSYRRIHDFLGEHTNILTQHWRNRHSTISKLASPNLCVPNSVYLETIRSCTDLMKSIKSQIFYKVELGIFQIDFSKPAQELLIQHTQFFKKVCDLLVKVCADLCLKLKEWYETSLAKLNQKIVKLEDFVEQKRVYDQVLKNLPRVKHELDTIKTINMLLDESSVYVQISSNRDKAASQEVYTLDNTLFWRVNDVQSHMTNDLGRFKRILRERQTKNATDIQELRSRIQEAIHRGVYAGIDVLQDRLTQLNKVSDKYAYFDEILSQ